MPCLNVWETEITKTSETNDDDDDMFDDDSNIERCEMI